MNWDQLEGQWQQVMGHAKSTWAKLTNDDLSNIAGKRDVLIGRIQVRYGLVKDEAEKQVDKWLEKIAPVGGASKRVNTEEKSAS